jgi:hypothetical protein
MSLASTLTGPPMAMFRKACAAGLEAWASIQDCAVWESHSSASGASHGASTGTSLAIFDKLVKALISCWVPPSGSVGTVPSKWVTWPLMRSVDLPLV